MTTDELPRAVAIDQIDSTQSTSALARLAHRPLWVLSGQLGVFFMVLIGFGERAEPKPKIVIVVLMACVAGMIALGPPRRLGRVLVTGPVMALTAWWLASYLWTTNVYGWWTDTQLCFRTWWPVSS